jgi:hypothetical protein
MFSDEAVPQTIRRGVRLPSVQAFGPKPPFVHDINRVSTNTYDAPLLDTYVERAPVRAKNARGLNPPFGLLAHLMIDAFRPLPHAPVRGARSPHVLNAVSAFLNGAIFE